MKNLEQIKNEYAVKHGFENWECLVIYYFHDGIHTIDFLIGHENEVMILVQKECLKLASERLINDVDKVYVNNENNIIK